MPIGVIGLGLHGSARAGAALTDQSTCGVNRDGCGLLLRERVERPRAVTQKWLRYQIVDSAPGRASLVRRTANVLRVVAGSRVARRWAEQAPIRATTCMLRCR